MGTAFLHGNGGGSAGLNFKIVGGTTEPSNPSENMIWVNTDVKITGWCFSATEPESPEAGMVWISVGTSSTVEFNALKKNGIQVYPISVKQFINGELVDATAKTYQNGEWTDWWTGTLYNYGVFDDAASHHSYITPQNGAIDYDSTSIHITSGNGDATEVYVIIGPVSLGPYRNIVATVSKGDGYVGVEATLFVSMKDKDSYKNAVATAKLTPTDSSEVDFSLDVSTLTEEYYIYIGISSDGMGWSVARTLRVHAVNLES